MKTPAQRAEEQWQAIHEWLKVMEDKPLGEVFREYVVESVHSGFDGFESRDVTGIRRMLYDLSIYERARG